MAINMKAEPHIGQFETLYQEYYPALYRFTYRMLGDDEEARDVTQETFVKLFHQADGLSAITSPKAWLYRVAANGCRDHLRRQKKWRNIVKQNRNDAPASTAEDEWIRREEKEVFGRAFQELAERERLALMLYQDELSYAEIATALGLKASSVGKLLARAIERLASRLPRGG
jgi:RNA polymerase sigma-70 factor (ECF subfamily)